MISTATLASSMLPTADDHRSYAPSACTIFERLDGQAQTAAFLQTLVPVYVLTVTLRGAPQ